MVNSGSSDYHVDYVDVTQHWHSKSQRYAGGDCLVTALDSGWDVREIWCETHWFAGMRSVTVYYFELERGQEKMTMPVIHTPYITHLIMQMGQQVRDVSECSGKTRIATFDD